MNLQNQYVSCMIDSMEISDQVVIDLNKERPALKALVTQWLEQESVTESMNAIMSILKSNVELSPGDRLVSSRGHMYTYVELGGFNVVTEEDGKTPIFITPSIRVIPFGKEEEILLENREHFKVTSV